MPSKIVWHNLRKLKDKTAGDVERGNILTWEQTLADRRAGKPIDMDVRMESESILYRTIWLFGGAFGAAVLVLAGDRLDHDETRQARDALDRTALTRPPALRS